MGRIFDKADARVASTASLQYGVFNLRQALAAGHTPDSVSARLRSGRWLKLCPKVYVIAGTPITWETHCMAATLWDPHKSILSGASSAAHRGLSGFAKGLVEVSTCSSRRPHGLEVTLKRVRSEVLLDHEVIRGIPTESLARTVLNLCGKKDQRRGRALDECLREGKLSMLEVWRLIEAEWTRGRRGIAILNEMARERTPGAAPTQSALEDMYVAFTREFDLPRGLEQWPMVLPGYGKAYFDFGYPLDNSAVEIDSYAFHMNDKEGFERDRAKDRAAKRVGIHVIRITHTDLRWDRPATAEALAHLLPNSCAALGRVGGIQRI